MQRLPSPGTLSLSSVDVSKTASSTACTAQCGMVQAHINQKVTPLGVLAEGDGSTLVVTKAEAIRPGQLWAGDRWQPRQPSALPAELILLTSPIKQCTAPPHAPVQLAGQSTMAGSQPGSQPAAADVSGSQNLTPVKPSSPVDQRGPNEASPAGGQAGRCISHAASATPHETASPQAGIELKGSPSGAVGKLGRMPAEDSGTLKVTLESASPSVGRQARPAKPAGPMQALRTTSTQPLGSEAGRALAGGPSSADVPPEASPQVSNAVPSPAPVDSKQLQQPPAAAPVFTGSSLQESTGQRAEQEAVSSGSAGGEASAEAEAAKNSVPPPAAQSGQKRTRSEPDGDGGIEVRRSSRAGVWSLIS